MELSTRCILLNAFLKAQFNYCPIIWVFRSRCLNIAINRLHERYLRMIYNDKISNFEELSNEGNSVSIHHKNIHALAIEMYKNASDMSIDIMNGVLKSRNAPHCKLFHITLIRCTLHFSTDPIHSVYNGTKSGSYLGPKIWEQVPAEIKNKDSLDGFRK